MKLSELKTKYKVSSPKLVTVKTQLEWKNKTTGQVTTIISAGAQVNVYFVEQYPNTLLVEVPDRFDEVKSTTITSAYRKFSGFNKPPTTKTLEKYSWDGIARTPTGHRTEPDGYGPDGSPSWLLIFGVI